MQTLRSVVDVLKKYNYILTKRQKVLGIAMIFLTLIGSLLETMGVSIILPLVQVVLDPEMLLNDVKTASVLEIFHIITKKQLIWAVCIAVIIIYALKNLFLIFLSYIRAKYACKVQRELSVEMLRSYMQRGYTFFLDRNTGELLRGTHDSVMNTYTALYQLFKIMAELFTAACICIFIMIVDIQMAFCVIALTLICLVSVILFFKKWMQDTGKQEHKYRAALNKVLLQAVQGIKEVLVMHKQDYFVEEYERVYIKKQYAEIGKVIALESPAFLIEALCVIGLVVAVGFKALSSSDTGMLVAQLASFAVGAFRILPSLGRISSSFNQIVYSAPGLNETYTNLKEARTNRDHIVVHQDKKEEDIVFTKSLDIKNVCWKYERAEKPVLSDLNLTINKGQSVALIGQSGAGKTTLADTILGLLRPQKGQVLIDNKYDILSMPGRWSQMVGFVPQAIYLIDDTIRNNIGFGIAGDEIDDEKIWDVLEQAQLKKIVENLPQGLDTIIGERGVKFSGGQKQRIAIARALYANPDILVLDEATSALDNETEEAVMEAVECLQGRKTLIIIAHRLTTVRKCDAIFEVKDGKALEVDKKKLFGIDEEEHICE